MHMPAYSLASPHQCVTFQERTAAFTLSSMLLRFQSLCNFTPTEAPLLEVESYPRVAQMPSRQGVGNYSLWYAGSKLSGASSANTAGSSECFLFSSAKIRSFFSRTHVSSSFRRASVHTVLPRASRLAHTQLCRAPNRRCHARSRLLSARTGSPQPPRATAAAVRAAARWCRRSPTHRRQRRGGTGCG